MTDELRADVVRAGDGIVVFSPTLDELIEGVAEIDPMAYIGGPSRCLFCGVDDHDGASQHTADCLWLRCTEYVAATRPPHEGGGPKR